MRLSELLAVLDAHRTSSDSDIDIAGLTQNSRQVLRGYLFVAVRGEKTDGHLYIDDAVSAGAAAVVCEEADFPVHGAVKIVVPDSRLALARLADAFTGHPSAKLRVVGVTGTNGKTTTTHFLRRRSRRAGRTRAGSARSATTSTGTRSTPTHDARGARPERTARRMVAAACGAA